MTQNGVKCRCPGGSHRLGGHFLTHRTHLAGAILANSTRKALSGSVWKQDLLPQYRGLLGNQWFCRRAGKVWWSKTPQRALDRLVFAKSGATERRLSVNRVLGEVMFAFLYIH